ncbi:MAG: response regulator transcription factor [Myxococcota bacterium]|jgi:two-component system OmpR family response regulator
MPKILVVDDDDHIRQVVEYALEKESYSVVCAHDAVSAMTAFDAHVPDLVLLDIIMPGTDGLELSRMLRSRRDVPIIFISSKDEEIDRVVGLEVGGDDYVTKPFSVRELLARVRAVLRRSVNRACGGEAPLARGDLELDLEGCRARVCGEEVPLTATEFRLLQVLAGAPGKVFTRDELMTGAMGEEAVISDRTIDSHIKRVRRKFEHSGVDPVETVHGFGYRLSACVRR